MTDRRLILCVTAFAALALAAGTAAALRAARPAPATPIAKGPPGPHWFACLEDQADVVLVVQVAARGLAAAPVYEVPIHAPPVVPQEELSTAMSFVACMFAPRTPGPPGAFQGNVTVRPVKATGVTFDLTFMWADPDGTWHVGRQRITAPIGRVSEHRLSTMTRLGVRADDVKLTVTFRAPRPSPAAPR